MDRGEGLKDLAEGRADDADCYADFSEFDDPVATAARKATKVDARAMRTRSRVKLQRALSNETLNAILPSPIASGDSWHILSGGNVSGLSYLANLLQSGPADHVILSTWCMSLDDVLQLEAWLDSGLINRLDIYCGEIFSSGAYATAVERICVALRKNVGCGRVAIFRNHSKVIVFAAHRRRYYVVVESSANLNTNPRTEQTTVTRSRALANFYRAFYDGIRSHQRNFDNWTPHGWPSA